MPSPFERLAEQVATSSADEADAALRFVARAMADQSHASIMRNLLRAASRAGIEESEAADIIDAAIRSSAQAGTRA